MSEEAMIEPSQSVALLPLDPANVTAWRRSPRTQPLATAVHEYGEPDSSFELVLGGGMPEVPGYEMLAELGRGGMGVVYLAREVALKRLVALKMILNAGPSSLARFRIEAEAVARLTHPNIVQIYQVGEFDGQPFLTLEYVQGTTLDDHVAGGPMPNREAAQLVETLARAMHQAHERGILHRDLKPANVLLQRFTAENAESAEKNQAGRIGDSSPSSSALSAFSAVNLLPKITDFGLAKLLDGSAGPTPSDRAVGTPSYMSPEQALGSARAIGVAADVYSLGAILYRLLTGRAPFAGKTVLQTLEQVLNKDAVPPRRMRRAVSRDLETICLKCLEKVPSRRYANAQALADDLRNVLEGKPTTARPAPVWERMGKAIRRRPALIAGMAALTVLVCLLATSWWYVRLARQVAAQRDSERMREFIHYRNEALFHGLLSVEQGSLFTTGEAVAGWDIAEKAAREALALADIRVEAGGVVLHSAFAAARKDEIVADCYTLLLVRADVLDKLGQTAEARRCRERARVLPPQRVVDHFLSGEANCRQGAWEQATRCFHQALAVEPSHFWSGFFLAVCELKLQRWESARAALNVCLAQQPDFVWAYLFRSVANEALQSFTEAEDDFERALRLNPTEDARYVLFLTRGVLRFHQQALEQAASDFQAAINLKTESYHAYLNLAHVYLAQNRFDAAASQLAEALRRRPPAEVVVAYQLQRARQLSRDGWHAEALQATDAALALDPACPRTHEVRGRTFLALGRFAEAERAFGLYLRRGGEPVPDVFRARGLARMKLRRFPEAVEDYTRVLERSPDAEIYQHRGWARFFADAWNLALRDFARAIELDPDMRDAYIGRGLSHVMLGRYREAIADAESALRREPETAAMMVNIACIFAQASVHVFADTGQDDRVALSNTYRLRAVDAVRLALNMLPADQRRGFWVEKVLPDPALAPIRKDLGGFSP
jgi:serine/threonine protein kinase/tetratricopeptide (TPR) repeat protein